MVSEKGGGAESKTKGIVLQPQHSPPPSAMPMPESYGAFQGVASYSPAFGFPQPVPPPGAFDTSSAPSPLGYGPVQGYAVAEGRPVRERRLPCCGIGCGWFLFIIGFFLAGIPWYAGTILLFCSRDLDYREKPGFIGCTIAAILEVAAIIFGVFKAIHH